MNNRRIKYTKLVCMLFSNDKRILLISVLSLIIGFTFLFSVTSLSETIIKTKQDNTSKTYGKFLMVIPEIDEESEHNLKQKYSKYVYEHFGVDGNIDLDNNKITMGTMKEEMGENLGFQLIKGKWPQTSNQVVIEEYLIDLLGVEKEKLPVNVSLNKEGKSVKCEITGIISNYSSFLSTNHDGYLKSKVYPSIIRGKGKNHNQKKSLVIMQKKLNYKYAKQDIDLLFSENPSNTICANEKLYSKGYRENEDMINTNMLYLVLLNFLLLLEQIVMIRTFMLRNRKTLYLFEALGMSSKEKKQVLFFLILLLIMFSIITGYLLAGIIGLTFMNSIFKEYNGFYLSSLHYRFLIEVIIVGVMLVGVYLLCDTNRKKSIISEIIGNKSQRINRYKFKKLDYSIVIIQAICIFFTMSSFYFINTFRDESGDIEFYLASKNTTIAHPLKEYDIALYENDYFTFDDLNKFNEYDDKIKLSMEAETKLSTILLKKNNIDAYFGQYCYQNDEKISPEDKKLWNQISKEAGQYEALQAMYVNIVVLPQKDYELFLSNNGIKNVDLNQSTDKSCVLRLPNYNHITSNSSIKEKGIIQLGGVQGSKESVEFYNESFTVESILSCDIEECSNIQVIISEKVAQKSKTVIGYNTIKITMKKDTPVTIQKGVEQNILSLMASIQGGTLDSSGLRNDRNTLVRNYTSIISNTMLFFCMVVICIYIILSIYIDWEKNSYENGVLRSFGMSYFALQEKLFSRYSNSIIVACIISLYLGKYVFRYELLTKQQILVSIVITVGITYICRICVYFWRKKQSISSMLNIG